jgi:hypothetical protein
MLGSNALEYHWDVSKVAEKNLYDYMNFFSCCSVSIDSIKWKQTKSVLSALQSQGSLCPNTHLHAVPDTTHGLSVCRELVEDRE